jgi:hypothetical protein
LVRVDEHKGKLVAVCGFTQLMFASSKGLFDECLEEAGPRGLPPRAGPDADEEIFGARVVEGAMPPTRSAGAR